MKGSMRHPTDGDRHDADLPWLAGPRMQKLLRHVTPEEIPGSQDLFSPAELEEHLRRLADPPQSLIAVGDIMLGKRAKPALARKGADYPFEAVLPLLRRSPVVLGNLEGPLARLSAQEARRYSYKVEPATSHALRRAGFNVLTLANNHILDCGRDGVLETLEVVRRAGIDSIGAGADERAACAPAVRSADPWRVGLLGYYRHPRCAATADLPGAASGSNQSLERDIGRLRSTVDRIVVTFHWGVPYEREPSQNIRAKARFAIECGADAVIGHHPHVVQPFEVHRGRPIFYSLGNFTFGSRNSRAEGLLVGLRFEPTRTLVTAYPLYVKNRDPRVDYQPKLLRGSAAERALRRLAEMSGPEGRLMRIDAGRGTLTL